MNDNETFDHLRLAAMGLLAALLLTAGCAGRRQAPSPCPPCPPGSPRETVAVEAPRPLTVADDLFDQRRYADAAALYRGLLAQQPRAPGADGVLFRLAVALLADPATRSAPEEAVAALRRLVDEHADSPYRPAAETLLGWRGDIDRLRRQIEELKRIDLRRPDDPRR